MGYIKKLLEVKKPNTQLHLTIEGAFYDSENADFIQDKTAIDQAVDLIKNFNDGNYFPPQICANETD